MFLSLSSPPQHALQYRQYERDYKYSKTSLVIGSETLSKLVKVLIIEVLLEICSGKL
jgi:hypothetical protein